MNPSVPHQASSRSNSRIPGDEGVANPQAPSPVDDKLIPISHNDLNVPPLFTPQLKLRTLRSIDASSLLKIGAPRDHDQGTISHGHKVATPTRSVSCNNESETRNRRDIFGRYWKKASTSSRNSARNCLSINDSTMSSPILIAPTPPRTTRKRSSSLSILESHAPPPEPVAYRMFSPPKDLESAICSRFASIDDVPTDCLDSLPPLPSPLRRLCSEGSTTRSLHGMYPLVTPIPILKGSSYRSLTMTKSAPEIPSSKEGFFDSFNLTQSFRSRGDQFLQDLDIVSNSSSETGRNITFDPRVTVTEFEDCVERQWYTESELEVLKYETVALAQEYLIAHPQEAERYNRPKLDQVTGTLRKRALFSLPVLSSITDGALPNPEGCDFRALLESHIRNILIVDPNRQILTLFCRSMNQLFPHARIISTQSGEEALSFVHAELQRNFGSSSAHRNFDIIIVEQRLFGCFQNSVRATGSSSLMQAKNTSARISNDVVDRFPVLRKPNSFNFVEAIRSLPSGTLNMCGSELIREICALEDEAFGSPSPTWHQAKFDTLTSAEASSISAPIEWRALLIGVSVQPDRDAKTLRECGADLIWGKPIPKVGDALRNQLLSSLINKRRKSLSREL